ncbi:uncharacterized protein LOC126822437 isoform X2 [Patella vulgata]|uniref:uncharacterized protein LOC126822437 isoform X2 n=1 Tax=Patella vulgata TaxID=6465 RepID=UPI0024A8A112|nr:uncharacterized protein LOC126822437 isoform X2 [Patella vulgata]
MTWRDIVLDQRKLAQRINSYSDWTSPKSYIELAAAGFSYTGTADRVKCDYCNKKVVQWTVNDDALEVHSRYGPDCIYLKHLGYTRDLNLPRFSKFSKFVDRLESVRTVQEEYRLNLPPFESIAEAGFFYLGTLDRMSCYHCGLILRDWERDTDPFATHKRFRPGCYFIICWSVQTSGRNINSLINPYTENQSSPLSNLAQQSPTTKIGGILVNLSDSRTPRDQKMIGASESTNDYGNKSEIRYPTKAGKGNTPKLTHNQITSTCKGQFNNSFVPTYSSNIDTDVPDGADNVHGTPPNQLNSKNASPKTKKSRHKHRQRLQSSDSEMEKNKIKTDNGKTDKTGDGNTNQKLKASQATGASNSQTSSEKELKNARKKKASGMQKTIPIAPTVSNKERNNDPLNLGKGIFGSNCSLPRHRKSMFTSSNNSQIPERVSSTAHFHLAKPLSDSLDQQRHTPSTNNSSLAGQPYVSNDSSLPEGQTYLSYQPNMPEIHSPEFESQQAVSHAELQQLQSLPVNRTHFPELAVSTAAADSHITQSLPPMFNPEGFSDLPMIQAVLQMGEVSYDSVVNTICTRYNTHGDTFPDAQSLLSSILDCGED